MKIELGCNYSKELLELIDQKQVNVDWIKLSRANLIWEELAIARPIRPVHLHILPNAGQTDLDKINWDDVNKAIEKSGSPHTAIHLSALPQYFTKSNVSKEKVVESLIRGVEYCKKQVSVDLLIENVPYYEHRGTLKPATDPEVIRDVCLKAGVGLLLDLAHLRVAAWHRNENIHDYLFALPLELVREIHINGPAIVEGEGMRDRHFEMQAVDYELLKLALKHTQVKYLTLEYGGTGPRMEWRSDKETLKRQLLALRLIIEEQADLFYIN